MKKCDLTWSILSTVVDYTENDRDSPYKEVNHSPIYSRFESAQDLIIDEQSGLLDERFEEVSCNLTVVISLMTPMMLALLIWDIINLKVKREPFQYSSEFSNNLNITRNVGVLLCLNFQTCAQGLS